MEAKKEKNSSVFFLFLILIIAAGAVYLLRNTWSTWLGNRQAEETLPPGSPAMTLTLREDKARDLLLMFLGKSPVVDKLTVKCKKDRIVLSGDILVSSLIDEAISSSMPELAMVKAVLPVTAAVTVDFSAGVTANGLRVMPEACSVGGYGVPVGLVPAELRAAVGQMLAAFAEANDIRISSIVVSEGYISIGIE